MVPRKRRSKTNTTFFLDINEGNDGKKWKRVDKSKDPLMFL